MEELRCDKKTAETRSPNINLYIESILEEFCLPQPNVFIPVRFMNMMSIKNYTVKKKKNQSTPENLSYFSVLEASFFLFDLRDKM